MRILFSSALSGIRQACLISLISGFVSLALGCSSHKIPVSNSSQRMAPAEVTRAVRESVPNDYLRVIYVPKGVDVHSLSKPGALRAFATASPLFSPPLVLASYPPYSGLVDNEQSTLIAMRCRPQDPKVVDALLATWPNVFSAVKEDLPVKQEECSASGQSATTALGCFAAAYSDPASSAVPVALDQTFHYAAMLFDPSHTALASWLKDKYGIYPAFSGTGFSVKDSYFLDKEPMTSGQILIKSISTEYILKNVSLQEAGCRCISVDPYPGRSQALLDPDFIAQKGGEGVCKPVEHLPSMQKGH